MIKTSKALIQNILRTSSSKKSGLKTQKNPITMRKKTQLPKLIKERKAWTATMMTRVLRLAKKRSWTNSWSLIILK
jgi:hypothetical protein